MSSCFLKRYAWPVSLAVTLAGCQSADETVTGAKRVSAKVSTSASAANSRAKLPANGKTEAKPAPAAVAEFTPPFPERLELFEPPKRTQGTLRRQDQSGESVELKGFVNVDRPRVVLSIDG